MNLRGTQSIELRSESVIVLFYFYPSLNKDRITL